MKKEGFNKTLQQQVVDDADGIRYTTNNQFPLVLSVFLGDPELLSRQAPQRNGLTGAVRREARN